ncbi:hypothetical protein B0T25DRAFT_576807, partial [Lasiosphaeria hispida]
MPRARGRHGLDFTDTRKRLHAQMHYYLDHNYDAWRAKTLQQQLNDLYTQDPNFAIPRPGGVAAWPNAWNVFNSNDIASRLLIGAQRRIFAVGARYRLLMGQPGQGNNTRARAKISTIQRAKALDRYGFHFRRMLGWGAQGVAASFDKLQAGAGGQAPTRRHYVVKYPNDYHLPNNQQAPRKRRINQVPGALNLKEELQMMREFEGAHHIVRAFNDDFTQAAPGDRNMRSY